MDRDAEWALLRRHAKPSLVCHYDFPRAPQTGRRSWFGGLPTLAPDIEWPRAKLPAPDSDDFDRHHPDSKPMMFMAQVDLSELPSISERALLPARGTLHFFMWNSDGWPAQACVLYSPPSDTPYPERSLPADQEAVFGNGSALYAYRWLEHTRNADFQYPKQFDRWEMKFTELPSYPHCYQVIELNEKLGNEEAMFALKRAEHDQLFGPRPEAWRLFDDAPRLNGTNTGAYWPRGFPFAGIAIEVWAGKLLADIHNRKRAQELATIVTACHDWVARARRFRFEPVPEGISEEFNAWASTVCAIGPNDLYLDSITREAFWTAIDMLAVRGLAALVPAKWIDVTRRLRHRGAAAMLGWADPGGSSKLTQTHVHLMSLRSCDGLRWQWNDNGTCAFWIANEDLAARRFDKTLVLWP
jgi:Domain of unknown function (DUF1963)